MTETLSKDRVTPSAELPPDRLERRLTIEGLERSVRSVTADEWARRIADGEVDVSEALDACEEITGSHKLADLGLEPC